MMKVLNVCQLVVSVGQWLGQKISKSCYINDIQTVLMGDSETVLF